MTKHLPKSVATAEGHLNQERQGLQSTKIKVKNKTPNHEEIISSYFSDKIKEESHQPDLIQCKTEQQHATDMDDDFFPTSNTPNIKTNEVLYYMASSTRMGLAFTNLTGKFPIQSSRGNNYILIAYHPDANAILQATLKNRQAKSIVQVWNTINN